MNIKIRNVFVNLVIIALVLVPSLCLANPEGGVVSAGEATITESASNVTINQASDKAVIDWRSFDIAPNEATKFNQPSPESVTLNRIHSDHASTIAGKLTANGNIVLVNQNGFLFTKDAVVDVNSIIATTSDIDNTDFMNGKMEFTKPGNPDAMIINEGSITAKEAGLVGMVAPQVINDGHIVANGGRVQLSSGDTFTVDLYGDKLMEVAVSDRLRKQLVKNKGLIEAKGGKIILTAAAGKELVDSLIVVEGELRAPAVKEKNGEIYIYAEGSNAAPGNVIANKGKKSGKSGAVIAARIDVSGRNRREKGGKVSILADEVLITWRSVIDASGSDGLADTTQGLEVFAERIGSAGGDIRIGGDYLGKGTTPTAKNLYVDHGAFIFNDSLNSGDAGRTIFWSDGHTSFYGNVFARSLGGLPVNLETLNAAAGGNRGNGGFVETSGKAQLDAEGYVNLTASNGERGVYFLDPTNIAIYGNVVSAAFNSSGVFTDGTQISLSGNLNLWLDASNTANVQLTYNSLGTTITTANTNGQSIITVGSTVGMVAGARLRLNGAGAVTAASTLGSDTYTISSVNSATSITLTSACTSNYNGNTVYQSYISQLTDASGAGNSAAQATAANMPLWVTN